MQRLRLMGLALMAIFALGAIASTAALAEEGGNPSILPTPTEKEPATFTSETVKTSTLETTKKLKIECTKATNKGEFTSNRKGKVEVDFTGCKSEEKKVAVACNTEGDANETILLAKANTGLLLVDVLLESKLRLGIVFKLEKEIIIKCNLLKDEVKGSVIGEFDFEKEPTTEEKLIKTKHYKVLFHQTNGEQALTTCDLAKEDCNGKTFKLEADLSGVGLFELAGEEAEVLILSEKEYEFHY